MNACPPENEVERQNAGIQALRFVHLVELPVSGHFATATCIYFDGITTDFSTLEMLDLVEGWFSKYESKPKVVLVGSSEKKAPRYTVKSMRIAASTDEAAFRRSINTLQFFPKGRTTIDDTWRPSVYAALSLGRPASAFFCVNDELDGTATLSLMQLGEKLFRSCASYGFWFPERFSPLGYYWGIVVEPAGRGVGAWGKRKSRRLANWRDNTSIGIANNEGRKFFGACDGYVRDAYPLMLLNEKHMSRNVGGTTLLERIRKDDLGEVRAVDKRLLWRIPFEKLAGAQRLLDDNDITLSGRRLESVW